MAPSGTQVVGHNRKVGGGERAQSAVCLTLLEAVGRVESPHCVPEFVLGSSPGWPVAPVRVSDKSEITPNALLSLNSIFDDCHPTSDLGIGDTVLTPVSSELKAL